MTPPYIPEDLEVFWSAWESLHQTRTVGMGAQAISYTEISSWLDIHGIDHPEDRQEFAFFITGIDNQWVTLAREKADQERERSRPKKK